MPLREFPLGGKSTPQNEMENEYDSINRGRYFSAPENLTTTTTCLLRKSNLIIVSLSTS